MRDPHPPCGFRIRTVGPRPGIGHPQRRPPDTSRIRRRRRRRRGGCQIERGALSNHREGGRRSPTRPPRGGGPHVPIAAWTVRRPAVSRGLHGAGGSARRAEGRPPRLSPRGRARAGLLHDSLGRGLLRARGPRRDAGVAPGDGRLPGGGRKLVDDRHGLGHQREGRPARPPALVPPRLPDGVPGRSDAGLRLQVREVHGRDRPGHEPGAQVRLPRADGTRAADDHRGLLGPGWPDRHRDRR